MKAECCHESICVCGEQYKNWHKTRIEDQIHMLQSLLREQLPVVDIKNLRALPEDQLSWEETKILEQYSNVQGPLPPFRDLKKANHYWVQFRDYDGRMSGFPMVVAWQPVAKRWCLPNMQATGAHLDLSGYELLAYCNVPDPMLPRHFKLVPRI